MFIFHKQTPEFEKMPKKQREAVCEMLKKGPTHLVKLRHPRLLTIHHSVEESRWEGREGGRERRREREKEGEREGGSVCVCVCVCVREALESESK